MSYIGFLVHAPNITQADTPSLNFVGEQLAQLVAKDIPMTQGKIRYMGNTVSAAPQVVVTITDVVNPLASSAIWTRTGINGAAAGNHTVTGIKTTDVLIAVVHVDDTTHASTDKTSEYTISATDTINNTSGTTSVGSHIVVVYYRPPTQGAGA